MPLITGVSAAILVVASCGGSNSATTMPSMDHTNAATTAPGAARVIDVKMSDIKYDVAQLQTKSPRHARRPEAEPSGDSD